MVLCHVGRSSFVQIIGSVMVGDNPFPTEITIDLVWLQWYVLVVWY